VNRLEKRWIIVLLAVLGLNAAVFLVFTLPRSLQRRGLADRREVLLREVELARQRVAAVRERSDAIQSNQKDSQRFFASTVAARQSGLVPVLKEIEELAQQQGLKVGAQSFSPDVVKGAPLAKLTVNMPVAGAYPQLLGFLQGLENPSPHFITLDEVAVRSSRGQQGQDTRLNLTLSCYFRTEKEEKP
jgi:Tfp pilus assembly protein PilO